MLLDDIPFVQTPIPSFFMEKFLSNVFFQRRLKGINKFFLLVMVFSIFFLSVSPVQAGLGYSPGTTYVEGIQPNSSITRSISFSRSNAGIETVLDISLTGAGAPYISGPKDLTFGVGEQEAFYTFTINTKSLPTGSYDVQINAVTRQNELDVVQKSGIKGQASGQTKIILAAYPKINFTVTNVAREEYQIDSVNLKPGEEKQPLGFTYHLINTGNVAARPTSIRIAVINVDDPTYRYEETIPGDILPFVDPFTTKDVPVLTKATLPTGSYKMDFIFSGRSGILHKTLGVPTQIFPPGTLAQKGILTAFSMDKAQYDENELTQFNGSFENSGQIGVSASLVVELKKDDKRLDILKTEPVFIPPYQTAQFSLEKRFSESGTYTAKGMVSFGIFNSNAIEVAFKVGGIEIMYVVAGLAAFSVLVASLLLFIKRRKQKHSRSGTMPKNHS